MQTREYQMNIWEKYYDMTHSVKKSNMTQSQLMDYQQTMSSFFCPSTMGSRERELKISEMEQVIFSREKEEKKKSETTQQRLERQSASRFRSGGGPSPAITRDSIEQDVQHTESVLLTSPMDTILLHRKRQSASRFRSGGGLSPTITHDSVKQAVQHTESIQVIPPAETAQTIRARKSVRHTEPIQVISKEEDKKQFTREEMVEICTKYHLLTNTDITITPQMRVHEFFNILQMTESQRNSSVMSMNERNKKIIEKQDKDLEYEVQKIKDELYDWIIRGNEKDFLEKYYPFLPKKPPKVIVENTYVTTKILYDPSVLNEHIRNRIYHIHYDKNKISEEFNKIIIYFKNQIRNKFFIYLLCEHNNSYAPSIEQIKYFFKNRLNNLSSELKKLSKEEITKMIYITEICYDPMSIGTKYKCAVPNTLLFFYENSKRILKHIQNKKYNQAIELLIRLLIRENKINKDGYLYEEIKLYCNNVYNFSC